MHSVIKTGILNESIAKLVKLVQIIFVQHCGSKPCEILIFLDTHNYYTYRFFLKVIVTM